MSGSKRRPPEPPARPSRSVYDLSWADADPGRHPLSTDGLDAVLRETIARLVKQLDWRRRFIAGVTDVVCARLGPWALGWSFGRGSAE